MSGGFSLPAEGALQSAFKSAHNVLADPGTCCRQRRCSVAGSAPVPPLTLPVPTPCAPSLLLADPQP